MNWINEIREEISSLDTSIKSLKKFGITTGLILILISTWCLRKKCEFAVVSLLSGMGGLLALGGLFKPSDLRRIHTVWMGIAFTLGSIVSRIILILMFYAVITPIGMIARLSGKKFLDLEFDKHQKSYWVEKKGDINYEKMY